MNQKKIKKTIFFMSLFLIAKENKLNGTHKHGQQYI